MREKERERKRERERERKRERKREKEKERKKERERERKREGKRERKETSHMKHVKKTGQRAERTLSRPNTQGRKQPIDSHLSNCRPPPPVTSSQHRKESLRFSCKGLQT